ncbi:MAG TPA: porin [Polyangiaceae bacterium]|nr:porin [Polyangiaceae bacterium]
MRRSLVSFAAFLFLSTVAFGVHAQATTPAQAAPPTDVSLSSQREDGGPPPAAAPTPSLDAGATETVPVPPPPPPPPPPLAPVASQNPDSSAAPAAIPPQAPVNAQTPLTISAGPTQQPIESRETPTTKGGPGNPAAVAAGPGGFALASQDQQWQIRFRALVQADGRFWFDDVQRPEINTFLIRRAQPIMEASMPYHVSFFIAPDFGGGQTVLQDAYLGLDLDDALRFRFGKYRPPYGLERLQPTSNLFFVEFGLPTLLTPNRDIGAMAYGDLFWRFLGYAGGIFNGVPDNGSADLATASPKEFAGRVYLRPLVPLGTRAFGRLFVGVATTFGRDYGVPTSTSLTSPQYTPAYKTPGQINDFQYISAASGVTPNYANTVVANGPHNRYGAYLYYAVGPFGLLGEYYVSDREVGRAGYDNVFIDNRAYQAEATFLLFGGDASYDFMHVQTPVEPAKGHFGALELAARGGHLDIDPKAFPNYASPTGSVRGATEVTLGINWYWSDNAKFQVNWDHTEFMGGASTAPELAIGHREAENIILVRAQVVY